MSSNTIPGRRIHHPGNPPGPPPPRELPIFPDFVFNGLTFKDSRSLPDNEERRSLARRSADVMRKIDDKSRCLSTHEVNRLQPGDVLYVGDTLYAGGPELTAQDIIDLKNDPNVCTAADNESDIQSVMFGIYNGETFVGTFGWARVRILIDTPNDLKINASPHTGLGQEGVNHWGDMYSLQWTQFTIDLMKYFLNQTWDLGNGQDLTLEEWILPMANRDGYLNNDTVKNQRGGNTDPFSDSDPELRVRTRAILGKQWLVYDLQPPN